MNRNHLRYRVWNTKTEKYESYLAEHDDQFSDGSRGLYVPDCCVVQLSTDIQDKNGNLIFENDVVKYTKNPTNLSFLIIWQSGGFVCKFNNWDDPEFSNFPESENLEILGNINENPELLKLIK